MSNHESVILLETLQLRVSVSITLMRASSFSSLTLLWYWSSPSFFALSSYMYSLYSSLFFLSFSPIWRKISPWFLFRFYHHYLSYTLLFRSHCFIQTVLSFDFLIKGIFILFCLSLLLLLQPLVMIHCFGSVCIHIHHKSSFILCIFFPFLVLLLLS